MPEIARPPVANPRLPALAVLLLLQACASSPGPQVAGSGRCDASALGWAIGQPADEDAMRRLSRESGAGLVNPVGPQTVVRQDRRSDRLRVFIDAGNVIQAVRCE